MPQDYNLTLNLPKTDFPMRAGLPQTEPAILEKWESNNIYNKLMNQNKDKPLFVLHDGPPYANGDIHMGTALNKTLKDFIVRYKNMTGFNAPFVPGWDTHGLPTELMARKKAGVDSSFDISPLKLRKICKEFTLSFLDNQRSQFKRLGGIGEWDNPYITLQPEFEAKQIEIFSEMATKGYIYKGLKPVYWCPDCQTALAEAEIEYADDLCFSIYVKFNVYDDKNIFKNLGISDINKVSFVIWTTTTWTLPGNVAVCLGPTFTYSLIKIEDEYLLIAKELLDSVLSINDITNYEEISTFTGAELEGIKLFHPFLDRKSLVIVGDHVTLESGTGCVHTAPGHGVEDYEVSKNYSELEIVVPVDDTGILTDDAGRFSGLSTDKASKEIADYLKTTGNLYAIKKITHQYPHCWRCKTPVLFRATQQWFCSVDSFKNQALEAIKKVNWIPGWGMDRISSMVQDRKDWCISRQRRWGVPIPIFYCDSCKKPLINKEAMMAVSNLFRKEGSDSWYEKEASDILPSNIICECGCSKFTKETDIMDVWFDSGVTHAAVCEQRENLARPADIYLEGADQYRGWFQSSLLTSVAAYGDAPYKTVITHGWVVDGEGKKMSKSVGNTIFPNDIVKQYGADILRLWVASSDYHADIRVSNDMLKQLSEAYRKIRNTARFILGNLYDYSPDNEATEFSKMFDLDKWALIKLNEVIEKVTKGYENYEYHIVFHTLHNFCVVDMSNFYLDILKDRLYIEKADSQSRKSAQTAMYIILDAIVKLISPILCFTSDEIWQFMPHKMSDNTENIIFSSMPVVNASYFDNDIKIKFDKILEIREDVKKALEISRANKEIGSSLEAQITIFSPEETYSFLSKIEDLRSIFITSDVVLKTYPEQGAIKGENSDISITVQKAIGDKCIRCWSFSDTVGKNKDHIELCSRCASILS